MAYQADPGGNFASDVHRRVAAAVPNPDEEHASADEVVARVELDEHVDVSGEGVLEVLEDLEADGDVSHAASGWKLTKAGFSALTGRIASDGGRNHGA